MDDYFAQAGLAGIANSAEFATAFKTNAETMFAAMNLTNNDTGGIGGADANGGTRDTTSAGTIPDTANLTDNPLTGFVEVFPHNETVLATTPLSFQVGSNIGDVIDVNLTSINLNALGLDSLNLVNFGNSAITAFDKALTEVTAIRSQWGAVQNRMEAAVAATEVTVESLSASRSRIQDADFATETATLTRVSILQQAGISILAQANSLPQQALSLLT